MARRRTQVARNARRFAATLAISGMLAVPLIGADPQGFQPIEWTAANAESSAVRMSEREFEDFELRLKLNATDKAPVQIRVRDAATISLGEDLTGTHTAVVRLIGSRVWLSIDDQAVRSGETLANDVDASKPLPDHGKIALVGGTDLQSAGIVIRPLGADEATMMLRAADSLPLPANKSDAKEDQSSDLDVLFDGLRFEKWRGAVDGYEQILRCKPNAGGVLFSEKEYEDFIIYVEFRLPPAGNNGVVLRYPPESGGRADGAYQAMTEIQILDDTHEKYEGRLDPRQSHGSAYGMAAAQRGHLNDIGEWNYQKITVVGPNITVELNGTPILETDLSQVDQYLADKPHPGKLRTAGAVGLAGHSDPVEFRLVAVRPKP